MVIFEILNTFLNDNCALLVYVVFSIRACLNAMPYVSPVSSFIYTWGINSVMIYLNIYPIWKYLLSDSHADDSVLQQFVQIVIFEQWHVILRCRRLFLKAFCFWNETVNLCAVWSSSRRLESWAAPNWPTKTCLVISLFTNTQNARLKLQCVMVEPHLWDSFAFSALNTNSEACQLSLLPYIIFFRIHKRRSKKLLKEVILLF